MVEAPVLKMPGLFAPLGLTRDADHVYGWNDGETVRWPIPSVTSIIRAVDRSGPLVGWAKRETAKAAVEKHEMIAEMVKTAGAEAAQKWLATIPDYQRDTAADMGSKVHILAEAASRRQPVTASETELPYVTAYQQFLYDKQPEFLAAEEMVCSLEHDYAGTLDWIAVIDGVVTLGDNKTGKGVYAEVALQLAAYRWAEFFGRADTAKRWRIPPVERCVVLHIRPELYDKGYALIPFAVDEQTFEAFLAVRTAYGWLNGQAKTVMGKL